MSEQPTTPQETYNRLINEANDTRRKRSLGALNEVCRLLHERGSSDFSYKTIITLGQDRGLSVPGEKSIVNATGAHYRELIQAWRQVSAQGKTNKKGAPNDWIEQIHDPVLRVNVAILAKELRAIKAKIARQEKTSGAPIYLGASPAQSQHTSNQPNLNAVELDALKAAIDPSTLSQLGFSIGSRGEIVDAKGKRIQKPGFRDAIEKILSVQVK
ncbi:gamma-mobile-trio protein GmtX [Pseudomonas knackmussii]|uniref:gamma-mobile-trio protein GmtX n=1 Tax=Pseudomonas knackmussii TaxID=65741 RepID=UPI003F4A46B5